MNRFQKGRPGAGLAGRLFSALIFVAMLLLFILGLDNISGMTARQEAEGLENSIRRSAVHCYALEGFYPDGLSYLEQHYGLTYDKEAYLISYEIIGSNLMPDISVIPLH